MTDRTPPGGPELPPPPPRGRSPFPTTRLSAVLLLRQKDSPERGRALEVVVSAYWKPLYKYVRMKWRMPPEDAEDSVQGFFEWAIEKGFFEKFDSERGRFRTFLLTGFDRYVSNERRAAGRLKRGGGMPSVAFDSEAAEREFQQHPAPVGIDPGAYFEREWMRSLMESAVEELRRRCGELGKSVQLSIFERYDLAGPGSGAAPTYEDLAREFNVPSTQVANYLAWARRELRAIILARLGVGTGGDEDYRTEYRRLLGGRSS